MRASFPPKSFARPQPATSSAWRGQRVFDVIGALVALVLLAPILAAIALAVAVVLGRPILFRQARLGAHGRPFTLIKFRSMRSAVDMHGEFLPDDQRLSAFGRWLRSTHLDELPQLLNILRGEMSLVGPRPLVSHEQDLAENTRLSVRPGLTGWAQIKGTRTMPIAEKAALDRRYIAGASLWRDLAIMAQTVPAIIASARSTDATSGTAEPATLVEPSDTTPLALARPST
ncbi:MAG: sugar transferase [Pseudomonadota bacterium]